MIPEFNSAQQLVTDRLSTDLPFNPTYRRLCWHEWAVRSWEDVRRYPAAVICVNVVLLRVILLFALFALMAIGFEAIYLCHQSGRPSSRIYPLLDTLMRFWLNRRYEDKICVKCGRIRLGLTKYKRKIKIQTAKRASKAEERAARETARLALHREALAYLGKHIELANLEFRYDSLEFRYDPFES